MPENTDLLSYPGQCQGFAEIDHVAFDSAFPMQRGLIRRFSACNGVVTYNFLKTFSDLNGEIFNLSTCCDRLKQKRQGREIEHWFIGHHHWGDGTLKYGLVTYHACCTHDIILLKVNQILYDISITASMVVGYYKTTTYNKRIRSSLTRTEFKRQDKVKDISKDFRV